MLLVADGRIVAIPSLLPFALGDAEVKLAGAVLFYIYIIYAVARLYGAGIDDVAFVLVDVFLLGFHVVNR